MFRAVFGDSMMQRIIAVIACLYQYSSIFAVLTDYSHRLTCDVMFCAVFGDSMMQCIIAVIACLYQYSSIFAVLTDCLMSYVTMFLYVCVFLCFTN